MSVALKLSDVEFRYAKTSPNLRLKDFSLEQGERIFLHGPSGSGKTTLLGLVTGVLSPQKGSIEILGSGIQKLSASQRDHFRSDHIGYIFQQFNLIPYLSVLENILLPIWMSKARAAKLKDSPENEAKSLIAQLGLEEASHRSVLQLSVGQQQRVAVARALIGHPELIVADEPTSSLDEDRQDEFIKLLLERTKGTSTTVLFVSHNRVLAKNFDRSLSLQEILKGTSV